MKRPSAILAPAFALAIALHASSDDAASRPTHTVARGGLSTSVELDGSLESRDAYEARYRFEGYAGELTITQIAAHASRVKKGDVLLKCDPTPWQHAVAAAENELRAAEAGLKAADESVAIGAKQDALSEKGSVDALRDAEKSLEYFNSIDGPYMLKTNDLWIKSNEDRVKDQEEELKQLEDMYKSDELTSETADIVRNRAKRDLENSRIYLELRKKEAKKTPDWEHPRSKERAEQSVLNAKVSLESTRSGIENGKVQRETGLVRAKMERERQVEALAKLKSDGEKLTIVSPKDGIVFYGAFVAGNWNFNDDMLKTLATGEKVAAMQVLLTVVPQDGGLAVRVMVPEDKISGVTVSTEATLSAIANPNGKMSGTVRSVSPLPLGGMFPAVIDIKKVEGSLVPGMKCKVTVTGAELKDVVLVPATAVGSENGKSWVWTFDGKDEKAVEVVLGANNGTLHEVTSGLKGGETILLNAPKK